MKPEAKYILKKILIKNKNLKDEFAKTRKIINDPRITNIGKFLRFSSLDELPQIINVFKGEMSFIGPRPIVKSEIKKYGNNFDQAFSLRSCFNFIKVMSILVGKINGIKLNWIGRVVF